MSAYKSDTMILDMYFDRNENAIKETDKKYGAYLLSLGKNILNNREDSEECVNDTYKKTWDAIPPNRPRIFKAFLSKIMRNISLDRLRERNSEKRVPAHLIDSIDDYSGISAKGAPDEEYESWMIGTAINSYLEKTSERNSYIFMSKYFFFMTNTDIAKKLGCNENTIRRELKEIKEELRAHLEKYGIGGF